MLLTALLPLLLASHANGNLVVSCDDCPGLMLFVDGQPAAPFAPFATVTDVAPGRHSVKVEVPNGLFSTEVWFNGYVDVPEGTEVRAKVKKGALEVYSRTALQVPTPPPGQPTPMPAESGVVSMTVTGTGPATPAPAGDPVAQVLEQLEEAEDRNDELDAGCRKKVANRLDTLTKKVKGLRTEYSLQAIEKVLEKAEETEDFIRAKCPRNVAKAINRKLEPAIESLEAMRAYARAGGVPPQGGTITATAGTTSTTVTSTSGQQGGTVSLNVNLGGMFGGGVEPMPTAAPLPQAGYRDCGTGQDPGCVLARNGQLPMDADAFNGFVGSLKGNPNEILRQEMAEQVLQDSYVTAKQLGVVLDQFQNEILKLEVANTAAPRVVDPKNAIGLSSKFRSSIHQSEFVKVMTQR